MDLGNFFLESNPRSANLGFKFRISKLFLEFFFFVPALGSPLPGDCLLALSGFGCEMRERMSVLRVWFFQVRFGEELPRGSSVFGVMVRGSVSSF